MPVPTMLQMNAVMIPFGSPSHHPIPPPMVVPMSAITLPMSGLPFPGARSRARAACYASSGMRSDSMRSGVSVGA